MWVLPLAHVNEIFELLCLRCRKLESSSLRNPGAERFGFRVNGLLVELHSLFDRSKSHAVVIEARLAMVIKHRRRHMHDLRVVGFRGGSQADEAVAEAGASLLIQLLVNAAVHPVAGDDEVGFRFCEDTFQSLMQVRSWKTAAGMVILTKSGDGFTGDSRIDDGKTPLRIFLHQPRIEICHIISRLGDAVTKDEDGFFIF